MIRWLNQLAAALLASVALSSVALQATETPAQLLEQANESAARQLKQLGPNYTSHIDAERRLVFVSALDKNNLAEVVNLLSTFSDAYLQTLHGSRPQWNITIILPSADDYRRLAPAMTRGFYRPADHTLIAIDRQRVLLHEFTHALHHGDAAARGQNHALWVCEGLASLFENCEITPQGLRPLTDIRLLTLQSRLRENSLIPLEQLTRSKQEDFARLPQQHYAQARYLMLYLYEKQLLANWYQKYKQDFASDADGLKALQSVFHKSPDVIDHEWREWLKTLQLPQGELRAGQARLGLEVQDDAGGVRVVALIDGGAAQQSGRILKGDILQKINGQAVANMAEFVAAVRSAGAMQTIAIQLVRQGQPMTILQPMDGAK